jgi:hypothetical protein
MKFLSAIFATLFLIQSCQTKHEQNKIRKLSLEKCDELNIVFYSKDTFVFKTFDTSSINNFAELITYDNEKGIDTCETTEQLIFKNKGQQIFIAQVSTKNIRDTISCNNITYFFESKMYRHGLTYRTGMGIDEIYWHKVDPKGNPWTGIDSAKFHYEDIKNNR